MQKRRVLLLMMAALFAAVLLAIWPANVAKALGPALKVSGGTPGALNQNYNDTGNNYNGKAYYLSADGGSSIYYEDGMWNMKNQYNVYYTSSATNSSNALIPPYTGWNGVTVSYGPTIGFASDKATVNEENGAVSLQVNISNFDYSTTILYTTSDGTAVSGIDYNGTTSGSIYVNGNQPTANISISIINDPDYEPNKTFTVTLSSPIDAPISIATCTVTIISDDPQAIVGIDSSEVEMDEDGGMALVPVTLSRAISDNVTVQYATANGTAVSASDYDAAVGTLTIPAGSKTANIQVPILDDEVFEGNETFTVTLSSPTVAVLGTASASITIADNEAKPTIGISGATVDENADSAILSVSLSGICQSPVTVQYATSNGTALAGADYTATSETLIIPAGSTAGQITIPLLDDSVYEGEESFTVTLSSPTVADLGTAAATVTLTDNEVMPAITANTAISAAEDALEVVLTVSISGPSQNLVTVDYTTSDISAKAGSDYTATSGTITIPGGTTTGSVTIPLLGDSVYEGDERFAVTLSNANGASLSTSNVTITLTDNEVQPTVSIGTSYSYNENVGKALLPVTLSGLSQADVTVAYATLDGTAKAGTDYTAASGTLTIPGGSLSANIEIDITDNLVYEGASRSFTLTLSSPTVAALDSNATAYVVITDNELKPALSLAYESSPVYENDGTVTVLASLSHASSLTITCDYQIIDGLGKAGEDFTGGNGVLTFAPLQTTAAIQVTLLDDELYEKADGFSIQLMNADHAEISSEVTSFPVLDDEVMPTLGFTSTLYSALENSGGVEIGVTLTGLSEDAVTVDYQTADATAKSGEDYTAASGTIIIPGGSIAGKVHLAFLDDAVHEGDETFGLTLSNGIGALLSDASATVTILDNEGLPTAGFAPAAAVLESADSIVLQVVMDTVAARDVTLSYATSDASAMAGQDYTAAAGTVVIPAGSTSASIAIALMEDAIYEGEEAFAVNLSNPVGAVIGNGSITVSITDNDPMPQLSLDQAVITAEESAGKVQVTLRLSAASAFETAVDYATKDGSAKAAEDYAPVLGTLFIPAGETVGTIEIMITNDSTYELDEDFSLELSNPVHGILSGANAFITIVNDDAMPVIGFAADAFTVAEAGTNAVVTVRLSAVSGVDASVSYATGGNTAQSGVDFAPAEGTVIIPAGSLEAHILIPIMDDGLYEQTEDFTITLSNPQGAVAAQPAARVEILESKTPPVISIGSVSVRESAGEAVLAITLSHPSTQDVSVQYETADVTAKARSDYRAQTGTMLILAYETSGEFKVRIINDDLYEITETFTVNLSNPVGGLLDKESSQAVVTIKDNDPKPTPVPDASPTAAPASTASPSPTAAPVSTATPSPTAAPSASTLPGVVYVDVKEQPQAVSEQIIGDNGRQETVTVMTVDENLFERTMAYARDMAAENGAQVILRFAEILPQEGDAAMRLNLSSRQVMDAAQEGMGVEVKMENITFTVPQGVLSQAASNTQSITLETRKVQEAAQPYFAMTLGDDTIIGQRYQFALSAMRNNGDTGYVDKLDAPVKISIQLTLEELAAIADPSSLSMCYINPVTGIVEILPSVYDPITMTLTFSTTFFAEEAEELPAA